MISQFALFRSLCALWAFGFMNCEQSSLEESRWSNVEVLLKSVIQKNQELEMKIQHMEAEIKAQKLENAEMKTRLQILEKITAC